MPQYLVRLVQVHESFRLAELHALAELANIELEIIKYDEGSPFCIVNLSSPEAARAIIHRGILSQGIYELWGSGNTFTELHTSTKATSSGEWHKYRQTTFRFKIDTFRSTYTASEQRSIFESFSYFGLEGLIRMRDPELEICVFAEFEHKALKPQHYYIGRFIAASGRAAKTTYDLKKRHYIATTSMDAELALLTANIALAAPGKLFYDPFMGTGGFPVACAHFGACVWGSDIDGRSIRGTGGGNKGKSVKRNVTGNFKQYGLQSRDLGAFVSDLTNSPVRGDGTVSGTQSGWLDGIVCDPPYGIREGLKVLGKKEKLTDWERESHEDRYREPTYIPPKRPYSFTAMLDDILHFSATLLVPNGRLSMWMPTANDEDIELAIPSHACLELVSVCVQPFNKWSRRLLTYRRKTTAETPVGVLEMEKKKREEHRGKSADELNDFRRKYFEGFKEYQRQQTLESEMKG